MQTEEDLSMRETFTYLLLTHCLQCPVSGQTYSLLPVITEQPRDQLVTRGGVAYMACRFSTPSPLTRRQ